ncbi:MAG: hypothetical protein Q7U57_20165 [Methylovulum sp.]|nr:hypothetical protein [Methylovulum sp.]
MSDSDVKSNNDSNNLNTGWFVIALWLIALTILGFYFGNFHGGLSSDNDVWGTFGDYVGGILNPLIAAFAFYLIAESYKLQKRELEATRKLLEDSTDAQKNQIKLAALTAVINTNLTKVSFLNVEKIALQEQMPAQYRSQVPELLNLLEKHEQAAAEQFAVDVFLIGRVREYSYMVKRIHEINSEIKMIVEENAVLTKRIEDYLLYDN